MMRHSLLRKSPACFPTSVQCKSSHSRRVCTTRFGKTLTRTCSEVSTRSTSMDLPESIHLLPPVFVSHQFVDVAFESFEQRLLIPRRHVFRKSCCALFNADFNGVSSIAIGSRAAEEEAQIVIDLYPFDHLTPAVAVAVICLLLMATLLPLTMMRSNRNQCGQTTRR